MKWLSALFGPEPTANREFWGTGALLDDRPDSLKAKDVTFGEIVAKANPVDWLERPQGMWRVYPVRNQGQGNSCMANAGAKALGVLSKVRDGEFITFSATDIYQRRWNKPGEGMMLHDVFRILSEGVTLEALVPSEKLTDSQIDATQVEPHERKVGAVFASNSQPIYIDSGDFDTVASVVQTTKKAVVSMLYFTASEYSRLMPVIENPNLPVTGDRTLRHGITVVDAFSFNGRQVLLAEDSAHFGGVNQRLLTREFFSQRNFGNAYPMQFKFDDSQYTRPYFDGSIMSAQACFRFEGLFPTNVAFVERIGPLTQKAILDFQMKHGIFPLAPVLGPRTVEKLKDRYGHR